MGNIMEDSGPQDFLGAEPRMISRTDPQVTSTLAEVSVDLGATIIGKLVC